MCLLPYNNFLTVLLPVMGEIALSVIVSVNEPFTVLFLFKLANLQAVPSGLKSHLGAHSVSLISNVPASKKGNAN